MQSITTLKYVEEGEMNESWEITFEKIQGFSKFIEGAVNSKDIETRSGEVADYLSRNSKYIQYALQDDLLIKEIIKPLGLLCYSPLNDQENIQDKLLPIISDKVCFDKIVDLLSTTKDLSDSEIVSLLTVSDFIYANTDFTKGKIIEEKFQKTFKETERFETSRYCKYLSLGTIEANENIVNNVTKELQRFLEEKTNLNLIYFYLQNLPESSWDKVFPKIFNPFEDVSTESIIKYWRKTNITDSQESTIANIYRNVEIMKKLGIEKTKFLNEEFGICCFGRYPIGLLERQYNNFANRENIQNLTWFIGGLEDPSGAFYEDLNLFESYSKDSSLPNPMIVETNSARKLLSNLIKVKRKYAIKIPKLIIISGHGNTEGTRIGNTEYGIINKNKLSESIVEKGLKPLIEESIIIFNSCGTGGTTEDPPEENIFSTNIAEEISIRCNVTTIAPEGPITGIHDLKILQEKDEISDVALKFVFKQKYNQYKIVKSKIYKPRI